MIPEGIVETSSGQQVVEETLPAKPDEAKPGKLTVMSTKDEIVARIEQTDDIDELRDLANLFGISLTKKEISRASLQSDLMDLLLQNAGDRIREQSDYLSNEEIMDFYKMFQSNIDRSRKALNSDMDTATNRYSSTHNEINITVNNNDGGMTRESRERIIDVVNMLLKAGGQIPEPTESGDGVAEVDLTNGEGDEGNDQK